MIKQGALEGVSEIYAVHTEPKLYVGDLGIISGAITSASDIIELILHGKGGHTSRPHLTVDIIKALGSVITNVPSLLSSIIDPRITASLIWGMVKAGDTHNAIPRKGKLYGTFRTTDLDTWNTAEETLTKLFLDVVKPYGMTAEINYTKGVPPVVNTENSVRKIKSAATELFGLESIVQNERSLGGEDFSYFLMHEFDENVNLEGDLGRGDESNRKPSGAMVRLGATTPNTPLNDIHQADLLVDDTALDYSIPLFAKLALGEIL
jgi:amidohydrolase